MNIKMTKWAWTEIGEKTGWCKEAKWGKEDVVDPKKKGMWDGYTQAELKKKLNAAKERQEKREKADPADSTLIKQIQFALRAKHDWVGSVK